MLDMFVFWLSYGVLSIFWWLFILSIITCLIDAYIDRITSGDIKGILCRKFVYPVWGKLGVQDGEEGV